MCISFIKIYFLIHFKIFIDLNSTGNLHIFIRNNNFAYRNYLCITESKIHCWNFISLNFFILILYSFGYNVGSYFSAKRSKIMLETFDCLINQALYPLIKKRYIWTSISSSDNVAFWQMPSFATTIVKFW